MAPVATTDTHLLLAAEVAEQLRITEEHVYRLARRGDLPCRRVGRLVRFTKSDIERFVGSLSAVSAK